MKLWMSGEIQADVGDAYREARGAVESEINRRLEGVTVPDNIDKWAFIAIIRKEDHPDYDEVVKRTDRGKILEFRLKLPHAEFLSATSKGRMSLIFDGLARAVELMSTLKVSAETRAVLKAILSEARASLVG